MIRFKSDPAVFLRFPSAEGSDVNTTAYTKDIM